MEKEVDMTSAACAARVDAVSFWKMYQRTCGCQNSTDLREEGGQIVCAECSKAIVRRSPCAPNVK